MVRVLINTPSPVRRGEPFEVKLLVAHPMESGHRRDIDGVLLPREIINRLVCTLNGQEIVSLDLFPAIAANPYLGFWVVASQSGDLAVTLTDDRGAVQTETVPIKVA